MFKTVEQSVQVPGTAIKLVPTKLVFSQFLASLYFNGRILDEN